MNTNTMDWTSELEQDTEARTQNAKQWGWRIARDYTEEAGAEDSIQGRQYREYQGGKHRYRLKDDDGETYYIIESDIDPNEGTESQLFAPLDWAMNYAGCTSIEYKDENNEYKYL